MQDIVNWGDGEQIVGTPFRIAVDPKQTDGHAVVFAVDMQSDEVVPPHVHEGEDQINVVISGRVGCRLGDQECVLGAGGLVTIPRGVEHSLWNAGNSPAKVLEIYTPPGIETFFAEAGARGGFTPPT
jgi:mannose-6-phosphate isomerase-like protein (cupin superfamily)